MQSFRVVQEFTGVPADFWAMLLDLAYVRAFNASAGIDVELLREERDGFRLERDLCYRSHKPVPILLRPLMPKGVGYLETSVFDERRDTYQHRLTPMPLGKVAELSASITLEPLGEERFLRVYEGYVSVGLPVFGKRLEHEAVVALEKEQPDSAELTRSWLAKYSERRHNSQRVLARE